MSDLFSSVLGTNLTLGSYLLCIAAALVCGALIALAARIKTRTTRSLLVTLVLLPAAVATVIMLVNGSVGTGIAVAGAFSLIRFRSVPGNARDIAAIFIAMAAGLACGTGYIGVAGVFVVIMCLGLAAFSFFGSAKSKPKELRITIPENLDYSGLFDDLFKEYTSECELESVKTTNMGSLYKLHYSIVLSDPSKEKEFIDKLRCRNANLEISCAKAQTLPEQL